MDWKKIIKLWIEKIEWSTGNVSFIRQHFSGKIISCAIRFVKKRLNMKAVPLVRFILLLFGASPSLAHNKFYRFYSYMVLIIMTANLYAYVIFCNPFSKIYWCSRNCYYFLVFGVFCEMEKCVAVLSSSGYVYGCFFSCRKIFNFDFLA